MRLINLLLLVTMLYTFVILYFILLTFVTCHCKTRLMVLVLFSYSLLKYLFIRNVIDCCKILLDCL